MLKKEKDGESSTVLAASLDSEREGIEDGGLLMCLCSKICTGLWMMCSSVIEKNKLAAVEMVFEKRKEWGILTCTHSHFFSRQCRRGCWWQWQQWLTIVSVGGLLLCLWAKNYTHLLMVCSRVIEKIINSSENDV